MKLELTLDEVSTIVAALLTKVTTAESNALKCAKLDGMDKDVEFWQEKAEAYKKVCKVVEAQFGQACKECEQADAEVAKMEEGRVRDVRVIIEGTAKEIAELLPNLTQAEVQLETENTSSNDQEMQMLQNLVKAMAEYAASHPEE